MIFALNVSQYVKTQIMVNVTHVIANKSVWSVVQMIGVYSELLMNVLLFMWKGLLREWETGREGTLVECNGTSQYN